MSPFDATRAFLRPSRPLPRAGALAFLCVAAACESSPVGTPMSQETAAPAAAVADTSSDVQGLRAVDVRFTLDSGSSAPISPFIYGVNGYSQSWDGAKVPENLTLSRAGGNRWSAYNWETNASNAGSDWHFQNDDLLSASSAPGEAVRTRVQGAFDRGAGIIVTVPMLGYASADKNGPVGSDEASLATRLATRFREVRARKGSALSTRPNVGDKYVYQDEFVSWLSQTFPQAQTDAQRPIMYSLDNEPDIWHETHEEIRSKVNGKPNLLSYDELLQKTIAYASAIKSVAPGSQVLGGVVATWAGATSLGRWPVPDPSAGNSDFLDYYLKKLRDAEQTAGRRLVDVLDVHWYTEIRVNGKRVNDDTAEQTPEMIRARVQAPRSLWDPSYNEGSWVNDVSGGPVSLLPRLKQKIAAQYPGTKLAVTEYYYGRAGDISGGIAQADVLGIFGREGVYAANLWPLANVSAYGGDGGRAYAYAFGAFKMFRDYDGLRSTFGNTSIAAKTSDVEKTSVYASLDEGRPDRVVVVAINKTNRPLSARVTLTHSRVLTRAEVYTLADGTPNPSRQPDLALPRSGSFVYTMPAMSVSTLVLK